MTDLTKLGHGNTEAVVQAAQWLVDQALPPHPIIPALRTGFKLSALEACEAAALAGKYRTIRKAHG